jgi:hypothetical protein
MIKSYYVIVGFDLTGYETDKFNDWKWTEEGEKYLNGHINGSVQLFDDPVNEEHLYLGYVLACGDEYDFATQAFNLSDITSVENETFATLIKLEKVGVILKDSYFKLHYKIIAFEECR